MNYNTVQETKYPEFIRVSLFSHPDAPKYASYYAALVAGNDLHGEVILLEEIEIIDRSECCIPLYKKTLMCEWEWLITGTCTGEVLERVSNIYKVHVRAL